MATFPPISLSLSLSFSPPVCSASQCTSSNIVLTSWQSSAICTSCQGSCCHGYWQAPGNKTSPWFCWKKCHSLSEGVFFFFSSHPSTFALLFPDRWNTCEVIVLFILLYLFCCFLLVSGRWGHLWLCSQSRCSLLSTVDIQLQEVWKELLSFEGVYQYSCRYMRNTVRYIISTYLPSGLHTHTVTCFFFKKKDNKKTCLHFLKKKEWMFAYAKVGRMLRAIVSAIVWKCGGY